MAKIPNNAWMADHFMLALLVLILVGLFFGVIAIGLLSIIVAVLNTVGLVFPTLGGWYG